MSSLTQIIDIYIKEGSRVQILLTGNHSNVIVGIIGSCGSDYIEVYGEGQYPKHCIIAIDKIILIEKKNEKDGGD